MRRAVAIPAMLSLAALAIWISPAQTQSQPSAPAPSELVLRGKYLAILGDCASCHTNKDGAAYAGGRGLNSGFGIIYSANITPDRETGIGKWSLDDIIGVLTSGRTPDFDFVGGAMAEIVNNTARLSAEDRRAIAVFLQSVPAVASQK